MPPRLLGPTIALLLVAAAVADAQPAPPATMARPSKTLMVLTERDIDPARLLPPPPADTSEAARAERAELHRIITGATPARMAQAHWDDEHENPSLFAEVLGPAFDLGKLPATAALLAIVQNDQSIAANRAKKLFGRDRPWMVDRTIPTCNPNDKPGSSYPSGHATLGYSLGPVLATLIPEKAAAIEARAADYAFSREVCGSHYPSDTEASHVIGSVVAIELLSAPSLQPKIEAAKAELRAAGLTAR
jgi:acid phosphatase (class A)